MTLPEFLIELHDRDYHARDGRHAGKLSDADVDDLIEWMENDDAS
jgi:hypothetical protein